MVVSQQQVVWLMHKFSYLFLLLIIPWYQAMLGRHIQQRQPIAILVEVHVEVQPIDHHVIYKIEPTVFHSNVH